MTTLKLLMGLVLGSVPSFANTAISPRPSPYDGGNVYNQSPATTRPLPSTGVGHHESYTPVMTSPPTQEALGPSRHAPSTGVSPHPPSESWIMPAPAARSLGQFMVDKGNFASAEGAARALMGYVVCDGRESAAECRVVASLPPGFSCSGQGGSAGVPSSGITFEPSPSRPSRPMTAPPNGTGFSAKPQSAGPSIGVPTSR